MKTYLAGPPTGWLNPRKYPPPKGKKIQMLTSERVAILGIWWEGARRWAPLLEIDDELKAELEEEDREIEATRRAKLGGPENSSNTGNIAEEPFDIGIPPGSCVQRWSVHAESVG